MYFETVQRLLQLASAGLTNDQLLWRLRRSGLRLSADEIAQSLGGLAESGAARILPGGVWQLSQFGRPLADAASLDQHAALRPEQGAGTVLHGLRGYLRPASDLGSDVASHPAIVPLAAAPDEDDAPDFEWQSLLAYYASTQRLDPRGAVEEFSDRHGESWQIITVDGPWWRGGQVRVPIDRVPPRLREALARRPGQACSVGYPLGLLDDRGVSAITPALLLPATCRLDDATLILEVSAADPVLNPRWHRAMRQKLRGWKGGALEEVLFPEGETSGFEDVVRRLGHAMATLVRSSLRPGQPDDSLPLPAEGLQNLVALFLPGEARFTQGAERDLETMRGWSEDALDKTALRAMLRSAHVAGVADFSPASPSILTHHQFEATGAALQGPLTVIQGPPGTGKSEVILSLLSSVLMAGKRALVVSKNHQALDEIERRLEALVGRSALLTRARDSDGERDTNLVIEWRVTAAGEARTAEGSNALQAAARALEKAGDLDAAHSAQRRRTALHVELSRLCEHLPPREAPRTAPRWPGRLLARLLARGWWRPRHGQTKSSMASDAALAALRRDLAALGDPLPPEAQHELADAAARGVQEALRSMPAAILPLPAERDALEDALRAFLFSGRNRAAQITGAEAEIVLRHRPLWAAAPYLRRHGSQ